MYRLCLKNVENIVKTSNVSKKRQPKKIKSNRPCPRNTCGPDQSESDVTIEGSEDELADDFDGDHCDNDKKHEPKTNEKFYDDRRFNCSKCSKTYSTKPKLENHFRVHKEENQLGVPTARK